MDKKILSQILKENKKISSANITIKPLKSENNWKQFQLQHPVFSIE